MTYYPKGCLISPNKQTTSSPSSHFLRGSYSSIHKNSNSKPTFFDISIISSSHSKINNNDNNSNINEDNSKIKKKLLFSTINDSIDKVKQNIYETKQKYKHDRKQIDNVSNYLLNKINELSPQKNNTNNDPTAQLIRDKSKEIINSIQPPISYRKNRTNISEFYQKNKHLNLSKSNSCSNVCAKNAQSPTKIIDYNNSNVPQSCQKIDRMKKHLNGLFSRQCNIRKNLYNRQQDDYDRTDSQDIFKASYRRKITNQIYDLKKFQFFIDYNARKVNQENLKQFAKNNLQIIKTIKDKCKDIEDEKKANELDVDIEVDDLI